MEEEGRQTGIDLLGSHPWGTHFCQFYETKEDLIEILVPYFKAGLESNEFCMWITSEPLHVAEATDKLGKVVDNLADYVAAGQIEILDASQWYTRSGRFDSSEVLEGWIDKEKKALERGFDGLRLTVNIFWLESEDWDNFTKYEEVINHMIANYRMLAICSYSLNRCGAAEAIDVVNNHQFCIIRKEGGWDIIENSRHKRIEETLRDRETELSVILDNAPIVMMLVDQEGSVQELNQAAIQFAQRPAEEMIGLHGGDALRCLYSFDDPKGCGFGPYCQTCVERLTVMDTFQSGNNHHQVEANLPFLRGEKQEELTFLVSTALLNFSKGDMVLVCIEDITDRKHAAEEVKSSRDYLEKLMDAMWDTVFSVKMPERVIEWFNDSYRLTGYGPEECIGKTTQLLYPDERGFFTFGDNLKSAIAEGKDVLHTEQLLKRKNGEVFSAEITTTLFKEKGEIVRVTSIVRDITERRRAEEALRESEEKYHTVFQQAADSIIIFDLEIGKIVEFNDKANENLGYTRREFEKLKLTDFEVIESAEDIAKHTEKVKKDGFDIFETQHRTKDGKIRDVQVSTRVISISGEELLMSIWRDITERKQAEQQKELSLKVLDCLNQPGQQMELIRNIIMLIKEASGFDAVGIRLQEGEDFPYYDSIGFVEGHVPSENRLCALDQKGEITRDSEGNVVLECMCGNVICGRFDPRKPFFTESGSFWTNCTTDLLTSTIEEDRQARTRNRCNEEGYESVALIPLKSGGRAVGLLQLNDTRRNRLTPQLIEFYQGIGNSVGVVLARRQAEERLVKAKDELEERVEERTAELDESTEQLRALSRRLVEAHEEERRTIAKDLHDQNRADLNYG